jgi:hypothetical protein
MKFNEIFPNNKIQRIEMIWTYFQMLTCLDAILGKDKKMFLK